jgi:hypothetical protein
MIPEIKKHLFPDGSNSLDRRSVVPLGLVEERGAFPSDESLGYSLSSLRDCIIEKSRT